ncbi:MAG: ABC transporter permease [Spirochaetota bacterium]
MSGDFLVLTVVGAGFGLLVTVLLPHWWWSSPAARLRGRLGRHVDGRLGPKRSQREVARIFERPQDRRENPLVRLVRAKFIHLGGTRTVNLVVLAAVALALAAAAGLVVVAGLDPPKALTAGLAVGFGAALLALRELDRRFAENLEIVSGRWDLTEAGIVLGQELARRLGLRVGDIVEIVGFDAAQGFAGAGGQGARLELVGIFRSGFLEYDAGWAFAGLEGGGSELGVTHADRIGVKLTDRFRDRAVARRIVGLLPDAVVESWRDYNRAIFSALRLEKTMMMLLVGLIFVVVAVNIYQSLRRSVAERTEEIGVLKALGADPVPLQLVFVFEGLWIGLAGALIGLGLGLAVSLNINALFAAAEVAVNTFASLVEWFVGLLSGGGRAAAGAGFSLFSPAYFYLDEVPAVVVPAEVAGIVVFAVCSATVAAWVASRRVASITPAEVLRYE